MEILKTSLGVIPSLVDWIAARLKNLWKGVVVLVLSVWLGVGTALSFIIVGPQNQTDFAVGGDGDRVDLNPLPPVYLDAGGMDAMKVKDQLEEEFPTWTVNLAGAIPGTLTIHNYHAKIFQEHWGGIDWFDGTFNPPAGGGVAGLRWIQMIDTNYPLGGDDSPYIDPRPNDDDLPFYWTEQEHKKYSGTDYIYFYDAPRRDCRSHPDFIWWRAYLFIGTWDEKNPGSISLHDGVQWGFDFRCVPEPTSLLALTIGLVALAYRRRRST